MWGSTIFKVDKGWPRSPSQPRGAFRNPPRKSATRAKDLESGWFVKTKHPGEQWRRAAFAGSEKEANKIARIMADAADQDEGVAVYRGRKQREVFKAPKVAPSRRKKKA